MKRSLYTRRLLLGGALGLGGSAALLSRPAGQASGEGSEHCHIRVDAGRTVAQIDRRIYGQFAEHLGRCIYGGVYDDSSPLADANGFRADVLAALRELAIPMIRWPGGFFASYYHWRDGLGPKDRRPRKVNIPWKQEESNRFGTDEFVAYCRAIGSEPQIVLNLLTGTVEEAAGWLEYCNLETDTEYANLRRSNGHAAPHNVRIWELDNEVWVIYPQNERGAADYADRAFHFATILKRIDPSIQLIACGLGKPEWDRPVLERLAGLIDYLAVHHYVGKGDEYRDLLGSSREIETKIQSTLETIDAVVKEKGISRPVGVAFNEYNIVRDWSSGAGPSDHRFELSFNLRDALWLAQTLNVFQRLSPRLAIANYSELVNVVATVMTRSDGMFRQPPYFTLQLYSRHCGPQRLDCQTICPTFSTRQHSRIPYLEVSATKDETGRLALIVANLHESQSFETRLQVTGAGLRSGHARVKELNGPSLDAENSFDSPHAVAPRDAGVITIASEFAYRFPAHSLTLIEAELSS